MGQKSDALHEAAYGGDLAEVRRLVASGTPVDARAESESWLGSTALQRASARGHLDIAQWLLKAGADPNVANRRGYAPLHVAASLAVAAALLDAGADVNAHTADGDTPLMLAAHAGDVARVRLLLARGADVNLRGLGKSPFATSALAYAVDEGHEEIVRLLVDAGVDLCAEAAHYYAVSMESLADLAPTDAIRRLIT